MTINQTTTNKTRQNYITGAALILIGLFLFTVQYIQTEWLGFAILPGLGVIFLAWGIVSRNFGLLIPGGILSGLGTGVFLMEGPFSAMDEMNKGGLIMLSFAAGWALMTILSRFVGDKFQLWPLIPGVIIGLVGAALLTGGLALEILNLIGKSWPLGLIAAGLYILLWRKGFQQSHNQQDITE